MQSVARGISGCVAGASRRSLQVHRVPAASTSRIQWTARRHASLNPLNWIQEKFAPQYREEDPAEEAKREAAQKANPTVFEQAVKTEYKAPRETRSVKRATEHKYSTPNFKISHRKLNMLGRQISGKPIDHAIMQMHFSEKRASKRIEIMLQTAKSHAVKLKRMHGDKLVVAEAWVTKGPKQLDRFEPRGRGKYGIRRHPDSRMHVVLKPGKTFKQKTMEERERKLKRIVSAGLVREDVPLRNPNPMWAW
ncbi:hypothetical protein PLICRDRAFT_169888 [Plicaturopsis crispa FD-325 SS-3]|nr:hypothetical protein PLICRDRAFT_169888 [Plicaturopsis crispa FD-325 SS-3]